MEHKNTISQAIDIQYEHEHPAGHRPHLGMSQIGKSCERSLWLMFNQAKTPRFSGRMLRLFQYGHDAEHELGRLLESVGFRVYMCDPKTGNQWRLQDPTNFFFSGSMDAVAVAPSDVEFYDTETNTPHIVDFKTCSNSSFQKFIKNGLKEWKFEYYCQLQCYMGFSEQLGKKPIKKAMLLAINKDNHELHTETIDFNQEVFDWLVARAEKIVTDEKMPDKCNNEMECRFCDFNEICNGTELPEPSCRLCGFNNKSLIDGEKCEKGYPLKSCAEHMYNPSAFDGDFTPIMYHTSKNGNGAMEYDAFINAPHKAKGKVKTDKPILTSREIYDTYMTNDQEMIDTILKFVSKFDASLETDIDMSEVPF